MDLWLIKDTEKYNVTPILTKLTWNTDVELLGSQLDFAIMQNKDDSYIKDLDIKSGDNIGLLDEEGNTLFRGIIITVDDGECSCLDYAFYFAKNEETIQFNKVSISDAIKTLCRRYGIECEVGDIRVKLDKIYFDTTIADMIKDMLDKAYKSTGVQYRAYMKKNILVVDTMYDYEIQGLEVIHELSYKETLDGMYNSIKVVSGSEEKYKIEAYVKDDKSIAEYGLLQLVETIDEKDKAKAKHTAETLLKDNNRVKRSGSIVTLGNDIVRAGMFISNIKNTKFTGKYLINAVTHSIENGLHTMQLKISEVV